MKISMSLKLYLIVSGLIGAVVGAAILLLPAALHATNGVDLGESASLLSEIRAPGGALLAAGIGIVYGAYRPKYATQAAFVSIAFYLSYGVSRLISMGLDGMLAPGLVAVTALELTMGLAGIIALRRNAQTKNASDR